MSDIETLVPEQEPNRELPAAEIQLTWRGNTTGIKDLTYGDRNPISKAYQREHDHADLGGVHLGMALERYSFGPYTRRRFDMDPGFPLLPCQDGFSIADGRAKLLCAVPCRLLGGVSEVHIDVMLYPELSSSPQDVTIGVVLRPFGLVNYNDFLSSITEGTFTYGHLKKFTGSISGIAKQRVTFDDLSRLGPAYGTRQAELCFFLMSDLDAGNAIHVCSALVLVSAVTTDVANAGLNYPVQEIALAQLVAGQPLLSGLGEQAKARGNALHLSVVGGRPGYVELLPSLLSPWVQELTGAHQHQGKKITTVEGTYQSDGVLFPYTLFSQSYCQVGENASDEFEDNNPCTGILVSESGVIGEEATFFQEVPLASGAKKIWIRFALRPETTAPKNRLALAVHLCRSNVTPTTSNNIVTSVDGAPTQDADGFRLGTVEPGETPGYQWSGDREGLGLWTKDAEESTQGQGVILTNCYRISLLVELRLQDVPRATEVYSLRYRFLLYSDQNETALDPEAGLLWVTGFAGE